MVLLRQRGRVRPLLPEVHARRGRGTADALRRHTPRLAHEQADVERRALQPRRARRKNQATRQPLIRAGLQIAHQKGTGKA